MKKLLVLLLCLAFVLTIAPTRSTPASADSLYIKKVVSVVYDDSGSMSDYNNYVYANYAMQTFCGMLNEEDELYVTYMSSPDTYQSLSLKAGKSGIEAALEDIKKHKHYGGTPFSAIEKAYEALSDNKKSGDANTQYWLVIITDGDFIDIPSNIDNELRIKHDEAKKAGIDLQTTFLGIGDAKCPKEDTEIGLYVYPKEGEKIDTTDKIIREMNNMADKVSGRKRLDDSELTIDGDTIKVTPEIPALSIVVLVQGSDASVTGLNGGIIETRYVNLAAPDDDSLKGCAYLFKGDDSGQGNNQVIANGKTYEIVFNKEITANDNIVVLYEPALEMRMKVEILKRGETDTNKKVEIDINDDKAWSSLAAGDKIYISGGIYEMGTNKKIAPDGTSFKISIEAEGLPGVDISGNVADKAIALEGYELNNVATKLSYSFTIPDIAPIIYPTREFTPTEKQIAYRVEASFGDSNITSVKLKDVATNTDMTVCFTVYADDVAITDKEAVKALGPVVTSSAGNDGETVYTDDGKIVFTPKSATAPEGSEGEFKVPVTCTLSNGISATAEYSVIPTVYTISPSFGGSSKSVKLDDIASNKDMTLCFTVYEDGVAMTDANAVKALGAVITTSVNGNNGVTTYSQDGKIVFTPNSAAAPSSSTDSFDVEVTCTLADGTAASEKYTVLIASYQVFAINAKDSVKKTGFYQNDVGVSFYIEKDGVRLDKAAVEQQISVMLNEAHGNLLTNVSVAADGTITVVPYTDKEHKLTFWSWWTNWSYYFGLEGDDVEVSLSHAYGSAAASIEVVEEDLAYLLLNVYLPLVIEIVLLVLLIIWIVLIITKPRYAPSAKLYVGNINYRRDSLTHTLTNFRAVPLADYNRIKRGNGRLKFKKTADVVSAGGIRIRADRGNRIICEMPFPWYRGGITLVDAFALNLRTPAEIATYFERHRSLGIEEFVTTEAIEGEMNRGLAAANTRTPRYFVVPNADNGVLTIDGRNVINAGRIFIYING